MINSSAANNIIYNSHLHIVGNASFWEGISVSAVAANLNYERRPFPNTEGIIKTNNRAKGGIFLEHVFIYAHCCSRQENKIYDELGKQRLFITAPHIMLVPKIARPLATVQNF